MEFTNENRTRYYGLRIGDLVEQRAFGTVQRGTIFEYGFMDNNRVYVKDENGKELDFIAEWCIIIEKVKDKIKNT